MDVMAEVDFFDEYGGGTSLGNWTLQPPRNRGLFSQEAFALMARACVLFAHTMGDARMPFQKEGHQIAESESFENEKL